MWVPRDGHDNENLESINQPNIILIHKINGPAEIGAFHLISLINTTLKIISKILATRLSQVINSLIDNVQSTFIRGRSMIDNIIIAEELIFSIQKHNLNHHIFKVNFSKPFDMVDWGFLFDVLDVRGFDTK